MRVTLGAQLMMASTLALGACAMDDNPADDNPADNNPTIASSALTDDTSADTPRLVTIPDELSFENLPDFTITGAEAQKDKCYVKIMYCHDPKYHGYPSYCSKGCKDDEDEYMAKKMCQKMCHHAKCNQMYDYGKCKGNHDHDGAPDAASL